MAASMFLRRLRLRLECLQRRPSGLVEGTRRSLRCTLNSLIFSSVPGDRFIVKEHVPRLIYSPYRDRVREVHTEALVTPDTQGIAYPDPEMQAAALALQRHLQITSKAYLSDAESVVTVIPVFLSRLLDLTKQAKQEALPGDEPRLVKVSKLKKNTRDGNVLRDHVEEMDIGKQVERFLALKGINPLEPVLESVGITSERAQAILERWSTETVDIQSFLFVIRSLQKLGITRDKVGDMVEKDLTVVTCSSDEIEASFNCLNSLMIPGVEVLDLIQKHPVLLKHQVVENIRLLLEELDAFPSKELIIRKAVGDNPQAIHGLTKGDSKGVVQYLRNYGFTTEKLDQLLQRHFRLLFMDVENQIKCNVKFLKDLNLSRELIHRVIRRCPSFLFQDTKSNLMGRLQYFKGLGFNEPEFGLVVSKYPNILSLSLDNKIKPVISEFQECGLSEGGLKKVILYRPSLFSCKIGGKVSIIIQSLKAANYSQNRKVTAFIKLFSRATDHRKKCEACLVQHGLSVTDAQEILDREPGILGYNEAALSAKLDNLTETLGLPAENVVIAPEYLSFGLKRRVLRRQRVLAYMKSKGLLTDMLTLKQLVSPSNTQFYNTFVKPNSEDNEIGRLWFRKQDGADMTEGHNFMMTPTRRQS